MNDGRYLWTQEMIDDDVIGKINPNWFNDIVAKEVDLSKWDGTPVADSPAVVEAPK